MLNHLTSGTTKLNFKPHPNTPGRMHQPGALHPCLTFPPQAQLQLPSQRKITQSLTKNLPYRFHKRSLKYEASLIPRMLSLVVRLTVAPPCVNKGNLSPLRSSSFLHCLVSNYTFLVPKPGRGQGTCLSLSDVFPHPRAWNHERCKPCPKVLSVTYVPLGLWLYAPPLSL